MQGVMVVTGAAVIANLFESYLGAALQDKALWLSNDIVNAIQICLAASIALVTTAYLYLYSCLTITSNTRSTQIALKFVGNFMREFSGAPLTK